MFWSRLFTASVLATVLAINRPVFKVILTQKGYTQFIRYDLVTPIIREFTFCAWFRVYEFAKEQNLFSYMLNGNNRIVRLWLESGGQNLMVSIMGHTSLPVVVDLDKEVWRHICLSYQSDYGAWAIYIDSRLAICEASQALRGYVLPAGGSVVLGYGTSDTGLAGGLEGEIYGANMILASTIERNHSLKVNPKYTQRGYNPNSIQRPHDDKYIVLGDLRTDEINNVAYSKLPPSSKKQLRTPFGSVKYYSDTTTSSPDAFNDREVFDFVMSNQDIVFNNGINSKRSAMANKFAIKSKQNFVNRQQNIEYSKPLKQNLETVSEFETPPKPDAEKSKYFENLPESKKIPALSAFIFSEVPPEYKVEPLNKGLSEYETPPPPVTDNNVYGQWISSKYAGNVLNYLKRISLHTKRKTVPATIPLNKISDIYPYASEIKSSVLKPPTNLRKKNKNGVQQFQNHFSKTLVPENLKRRHFKKRAVNMSEFNVELLENDSRSEIMDSHAQTEVKNIEIITQSQFKKKIDNTLPQNHRNIVNEDDADDDNYSQTDHKMTFNGLFNGLPFLKSVEYFTGDPNERSRWTKKKPMYTKNFTISKWQHVNPYNSDYRTQPDVGENNFHTSEEFASNKKHQSLGLKYIPESNKVVDNEDESIIKARELAVDVSNQSEVYKDVISLLKYNHGFLPAHDEKRKLMNRTEPKYNIIRTNKFNTRVKIGNALNEKNLIEDHKENSFIGGNTRIPDILKYRSDIDNVQDDVPPSLKPKICQNVELLDNILYIHPDGSIDMTHILSPVKARNKAIEFILDNYRQCSFEGSTLEKHELLLIHWNKTPMRLFGGAEAKMTKDLCGFF